MASLRETGARLKAGLRRAKDTAAAFESRDACVLTEHLLAILQIFILGLFRLLRGLDQSNHIGNFKDLEVQMSAKTPKTAISAHPTPLPSLPQKNRLPRENDTTA